jgi:hypothetical protein
MCLVLQNKVAHKFLTNLPAGLQFIAINVKTTFRPPYPRRTRTRTLIVAFKLALKLNASFPRATFGSFHAFRT